jgi:hypothetical protein
MPSVLLFLGCFSDGLVLLSRLPLDHDPPASTSRVARITSMSHHTWPSRLSILRLYLCQTDFFKFLFGRMAADQRFPLGVLVSLNTVSHSNAKHPSYCLVFLPADTLALVIMVIVCSLAPLTTLSCVSIIGVAL